MCTQLFPANLSIQGFQNVESVKENIDLLHHKMNQGGCNASDITTSRQPVRLQATHRMLKLTFTFQYEFFPHRTDKRETNTLKKKRRERNRIVFLLYFILILIFMKD